MLFPTLTFSAVECLVRAATEVSRVISTSATYIGAESPHFV